MKFVKTYEDLLSDYEKRRQEYDHYKFELKKLLEQFIRIRTDRWKDWEVWEDFKRVKNFNYLVQTSKIIIEWIGYDEDEWWEFTLKGDDFKEFLIFMENPEIYGNSKKYNL